MRVAFGTTVLERGMAQGSVDGIGSYTRELLCRLRGAHELELVPFSYSRSERRVVRDKRLDLGPFGPQALYSSITGQSFPVANWRVSGQVDLLHATDHLIPLVRKVPVVATLMDAIPLAHPEWVAYSLRGLRNWIWRRSANWPVHILTISGHARQELIQWFGLREDRISVTPLGVDSRWFETPPVDDLERVKDTYVLPERFFLFVGTLQPRKNLARLIAAHRMLSRSERMDYPLYVVGRAGWGCKDEVSALQESDNGTMKWLRYVSDADLVPLVRCASALVFPSLHEGFGLPVLEAFAAGVPVIASNTTSVPEVAGDAALLIDPERVDEISDAMRQVIGNAALADRLRVRGRERALQFTWEHTAALTMDVYRRVIDSQ